MRTLKNTYKKRYKQTTFLSIILFFNIIVCTTFMVTNHDLNLVYLSFAIVLSISIGGFIYFIVKTIYYERKINAIKNKINKYRKIIHLKLIMDAIEKKEYDNIIRMLNYNNYILPYQEILLWGIIYTITKTENIDSFSNLVKIIDEHLLIPYS